MHALAGLRGIIRIFALLIFVQGRQCNGREPGEMFLGKIHVLSIFRLILLCRQPKSIQKTGLAGCHCGKAPAGPPGRLILDRSHRAAASEIKLPGKCVRFGLPVIFTVDIPHILTVPEKCRRIGCKFLLQVGKGLFLNIREICQAHGAGNLSFRAAARLSIGLIIGVPCSCSRVSAGFGSVCPGIFSLFRTGFGGCGSISACFSSVGFISAGVLSHGLAGCCVRTFRRIPLCRILLYCIRR